MIKTKDNFDTSNQVKLLMNLNFLSSFKLPEIPNSLPKLPEIPNSSQMSERDKRLYLYNNHKIIFKNGSWQKVPDSWITKHEEVKLQRIELRKRREAELKIINAREREREQMKLARKERERLEKIITPAQNIEYMIRKLVADSIKRVQIKLIKDYNETYKETKLSVDDALHCNIPDWKKVLELRIQHLNNDLKSCIENMNYNFGDYFECDDYFGYVDVKKTDDFKYWLDCIHDNRKELFKIASVLFNHVNKNVE